MNVTQGNPGRLDHCTSVALTRERLRNQKHPSKSSCPAAHVATPKPVGCLAEVSSLTPHCVLSSVALGLGSAEVTPNWEQLLSGEGQLLLK